jgi:predicted RNase H-like HicB family nuclease
MMNKSIADYTVVVRPDDATFVAYVPAIDGCHAVAGTPELARAELDHVFAMICEEYEERGSPLPRDVAELVAYAS